MSTKSAPFLLRDPTVSDFHIAFSYGGNIWVANRDGGQLRRVTAGGCEENPVLSPDGEYLAFVGAYDGPRSVFVVPVEGGEPKRVTYHPDDFATRNSRAGSLGWTPDGERILFSSRRAAFAGGSHRVTQLFTVSREGGPAVPVPLVRAAEGSFSADLTCIAYVPHVPWQPEWKGYRGGGRCNSSELRV